MIQKYISKEEEMKIFEDFYANLPKHSFLYHILQGLDEEIKYCLQFDLLVSLKEKYANIEKENQKLKEKVEQLYSINTPNIQSEINRLEKEIQNLKRRL